MTTVKIQSIILALFLVLIISLPTFAQTDPRIGVRGGVGTDVNGGLAYGVGVNYMIDLPQKNSLELGVVYFGGSFEESSSNGFNTYDEKTDIGVFGLLANYLIGYTPENPGTFFIVGFGLASVSMEWEERSTTDVSLGTPLPGGGSMQSVDGSGGGSVFNLGFGNVFNGGFDVRAEIPVIVSFSAPGEASAVIPTFIVTAGLRF